MSPTAAMWLFGAICYAAGFLVGWFAHRSRDIR